MLPLSTSHLQLLNFGHLKFACFVLGAFLELRSNAKQVFLLSLNQETPFIIIVKTSAGNIL